MKKIGLSLSGGGLRGIAHLGVLKSLNENEIYPEIICGTSMGAIIAALYAAGMDYQDIKKIAYSIESSILDLNIFGILKSLLKFQIPNGIFKGNRIERLLKKKTKNINIKNIENMKLAVIATNLDGGENVVFTNCEVNDSGKMVYINDVTLSKAVRSSISLPIIFKPIYYGNYTLIDGGIVNNCPCNVSQKLGADIVISSDISYNGTKMSNKRNGKEIIQNTIGVLLKEASDDDRVDIAIPRINIKLDQLRDIPMLSFSKENFDNAMELGYRKTNEKINEIVSILN